MQKWGGRITFTVIFQVLARLSKKSNLQYFYIYTYNAILANLWRRKIKVYTLVIFKASWKIWWKTKTKGIYHVFSLKKQITGISMVELVMPTILIKPYSTSKTENFYYLDRIYYNNEEQYIPVPPVAKGGYEWILIFLCYLFLKAITELVIFFSQQGIINHSNETLVKLKDPFDGPSNPSHKSPSNWHKKSLINWSDLEQKL